MPQTSPEYPPLPTHLPDLFNAWSADPDQLPAGAPGKVGVLQLQFAPGPGGTQLVRHYATGPQRVQRALHLDPALPDMAFAVIQSVSGGVLQGDRLATDITVRSGARAHVTTQSATKIYRMDRNYATQRLTITVQPDGYLEYLPDYVIPYQTARFYSEADLTIADDATLVIAELLAPGRVASGEAFRFDALCSRTQARTEHGQPRFTDLVRLTPHTTPPGRSGLLADQPYYAALWVLTRQIAADRLAADLVEAAEPTTTLTGASALPHEDGAVLRVVGATGPVVHNAVLAAWSTTRRLLLGVPTPHIQRIKYGFQPAAHPQVRPAVGSAP